MTDETSDQIKRLLDRLERHTARLRLFVIGVAFLNSLGILLVQLDVDFHPRGAVLCQLAIIVWALRILVQEGPNLKVAEDPDRTTQA